MGYAQDPAFYTIGEKEFANTDIYTMLYDRQTDVIFVGTNSGMYVYKQNEFKPVQGHKNQIGNSFFQLKQNSKGEVFCCNLNGQVFQIIDNKLHIVYSSSETSAHFINYNILSNDRKIITFRKAILFEDANGNFSPIFSKEKPLVVNNDTLKSAYSCNTFGNSTFIYGISTTKNLYITLDSNAIVQHTNLEDRTLIVSTNFVKQKGIVYGIQNDGSIVSFTDSLFQNFDMQEKERLYNLNDSVVVGLGSQSGFRYFSLNESKDTISSSEIIFKDLFISAYANLENGGLILGTFGEGIIVVVNPKIQKSYHNHLLLGITTSPENRTAISTRSGEIFEVENGKLNLIDTVPHNVDNIFYIPNSSFFNNLGYEDFIYNDSRKKSHSIIDLHEGPFKLVFCSNKTGVAILGDENQDYSNVDFEFTTSKNYRYLYNSSRTSSTTWSEKDSVMFFGTNNGLFKRRLDNKSLLEISFSKVHLDINDVSMCNDTLVCATENNGLLLFKNDQLIFQLDTKNGLYSNMVKQAEMKNNIIYLITRYGLQLYDIKKNKFISIGPNEGVEPDKITKFALSNDKLWLLEKHSFLAVELNKITQNNNPLTISNLYFDSIQVNNEKVNFLEENLFHYDKNAFTFYFDYRDLLTKKETQIQYTLKGFYNNWKIIPTSQNSIEFESLPIGKYTFLIKAIYRDQETETFSYSFEVSPPFWQRIWFYVLIGLFSAGLITLVAVYRIRSIRRKNNEESLKNAIEKNAIDAQLKAIRAQMNPHFIFNSINSIQDLVLQQETLKSYDYLVVFSRMVRKTLEFSEREFITTQEELDFLETYLGLEKLRFKDDFKFHLESTLSSNSIKIPSLIVQPFAENAIKHGLLHKEGKKVLKISFHEEDSHVICVVEDNGIGTDEANKIKVRQQSDHKSFSTEAIARRLEMLEMQSNGKVGFVTENILDNKGLIMGTKVTITLPVKN